VQVDVASRAPHARKYGSTFAESWTSADGATIVAVGAVLAGATRSSCAICCAPAPARWSPRTTRCRSARRPRPRRAAARARSARRRARRSGHVPRARSDRGDVEVAGAGQLHAALIDGSGVSRSLHGRAGALGTGIEPKDLVERIHLRRDDLLVAATVPIDPAGGPPARAPPTRSSTAAPATKPPPPSCHPELVGRVILSSSKRRRVILSSSKDGRAPLCRPELDEG